MYCIVEIIRWTECSFKHVVLLVVLPLLGAISTCAFWTALSNILFRCVESHRRRRAFFWTPWHSRPVICSCSLLPTLPRTAWRRRVKQRQSCNDSAAAMFTKKTMHVKAREAQSLFCSYCSPFMIQGQNWREFDDGGRKPRWPPRKAQTNGGETPKYQVSRRPHNRLPRYRVCQRGRECQRAFLSSGK